MEYVFVVFVNFWKSVLEWRQHLVRFNYNHFRLEHLYFSVYSENLEISLNSAG